MTYHKLVKMWNGYFAVCPTCGKVMAQMMDGRGISFGCMYCHDTIKMSCDEYDYSIKASK